MLKKSFDLHPRNLLYKSIFDTLKSLLYDLDEKVGSLFLKEEDGRYIQYTLKGKPDIFIDMRLIPDPTNPSITFTLALLMHIDNLFQVTLDFYLTQNNYFVLKSWEDTPPKIRKLVGANLSLDQMISITNYLKWIFYKTIEHRDALISIFFKKAGVIGNSTHLRFKEEEIEIWLEPQRFRFAIHKEQGKFKVLFDDILSQNLTSVTNGIEKIAYHITQKYFGGNYENIEWFQIFSFKPYVIVQQIELKPYMEKRRKYFFFKEMKFRRYKDAKYTTIASFEASEAKRIFHEFMNQYKLIEN